MSNWKYPNIARAFSLNSPGRIPVLLSGWRLVEKKRLLPQQVASRDRFPRHVFGNCETNDIASGANAVFALRRMQGQ
jgi:hypothetical protein